MEGKRETRACGIMTNKLAMLTKPNEVIDAAQPMRPMARENWMIRSVSLDAHMPVGETCGGGGLESIILVRRKVFGKSRE